MSKDKREETMREMERRHMKGSVILFSCISVFLLVFSGISFVTNTFPLDFAILVDAGFFAFLALFSWYAWYRSRPVSYIGYMSAR